MSDNNDHVDEATSIFEEYSFILSIDHWATADLVHFANLIDIELQRRADDPNEFENSESVDYAEDPPWDEET